MEMFMEIFMHLFNHVLCFLNWFMGMMEVNQSPVNLFFFFISTIGMCHIIVDGSIMKDFRDFVKKVFPRLGGAVDCYLCCGVWCGFFMGFVWMTYNPIYAFACACAGGFAANVAAIVLNWIEAATVINLPDEN
jgi:hypothetical protein